MGTFKPGPMGVVKGLIDTIVACKWKETYVIKGRPTRSKKAASSKQADQQMRFALVTTLLKRIGTVIAVGYQNSGKNLTQMNVASRYHLENAVTGTYPKYVIDFAKVKISNGDESSLNFAWMAKVEAGAEQLLTVSWQPSPYPGKTSSISDTITILFYIVEKDMFITLENAALRSDLLRAEPLPGVDAGDSVHCWIMMVSADGKRTARNQYLGMVKLLA